MNRASACLAVSLAALTIACSATQPMPPVEGPFQLKTGQPFPDLVLPALADGQPSSLRQYRGQKVLLHVFASW